MGECRENLYERWSVALATARIGIWDWRLDTNETVYDDAYYAIAGYEPGAYPTTYEEWNSRIHPDDRERVNSVLQEYLDGERPQHEVEFRFRRADGTWMWIAGAGRIVERDADGAPLRMVGIHQDITPLRTMEEQLRHAQRLDAIGRLAGGIAHDFNNMLGGILGYGELLTSQLDPGTESHENAQHICRAAERAGSLTGKLLAFSRRGQRSLEVFDVREEVRSVRDLLARTLPQNIELTVETGGADAFAEGDPVQVQSALLNLAVNARDAMPDGGRLKIRVRRRSLDRPAANACGVTPGDFVEIDVVDTGTGIAADVLENIFDPYFTTKGFGKGTGLGLAAAYGTAREHGGTVQVESELGQGSRFRFLVPSSAGRPAPKVEEAVEPATGGTVLVVDDEDLVRNVTAGLLRRSGYEVIEAVDGEEAEAVYRERGQDIDLVVLDVSMPGMGGAGAFAAIREIDPGAQIVLATGFVEGNQVADRNFPGRAGLLRKPFRRAELEGVVGSILARQRRR